MAHSRSYKSKVELKHATFFLRNDGIIEIVSDENFEYDVDAIKENHEIIKQLSPHSKALILNIAGKFTSVATDVRDFLAHGPHKEFIKAEAFVLQSLAQKLLANFYLNVNKPKVPAAFFTTKAAAVKWLQSKK